MDTWTSDPQCASVGAARSAARVSRRPSALSETQKHYQPSTNGVRMALKCKEAHQLLCLFGFFVSFLFAFWWWVNAKDIRACLILEGHLNMPQTTGLWKSCGTAPSSAETVPQALAHLHY